MALPSYLGSLQVEPTFSSPRTTDVERERTEGWNVNGEVSRAVQEGRECSKLRRENIWKRKKVESKNIIKINFDRNDI